jgi:hypothetical protein
MTTTNTPHKIIVVLKLPNPVADLVVRADSVHDALVANAKMFPSPPLPLAQFAADILALSTAEAAVKARTSGGVAVRDAARKVVVLDLNTYRGYVEVIANADPSNADKIAQAAVMSTRKATKPSKSDLAAKAPSSGIIKLVAKATKGARAYDWQYSTDGGKTWISVPTTTRASTTITGLLTGSTVQFRHRPVPKTGARTSAPS